MATGFRTVADPYTGQEWVAIPAIVPDWAILHVQIADTQGNIRIRGPRYDDLLLAKAARQVLVTCETVVAPAELMAESAADAAVDLPAFLVSALALAPGGAAPGGCHGCYHWDPAFFTRYLAAAASPQDYQAFLADLPAGPLTAPRR